MCNCPNRRGNAACSCIPATIQLKDSIGANVGLPIPLTFGAIVNVPLPAGSGSATTPTLTQVTSLFVDQPACDVVPTAVRFLGDDGTAWDASSIGKSGARRKITFQAVTANATINPAQNNVYLVQGGTSFVLQTPALCDPNEVWVKNLTPVAITITAQNAASLDSAPSFVLYGAQGTGGPPAGQPCIHFAFDGTNWWAI